MSEEKKPTKRKGRKKGSTTRYCLIQDELLGKYEVHVDESNIHEYPRSPAFNNIIFIMSSLGQFPRSNNLLLRAKPAPLGMLCVIA